MRDGCREEERKKKTRRVLAGVRDGNGLYYDIISVMIKIERNFAESRVPSAPTPVSDRRTHIRGATKNGWFF